MPRLPMMHERARGEDPSPWWPPRRCRSRPSAPTSAGWASATVYAESLSPRALAPLHGSPGDLAVVRGRGNTACTLTGALDFATATSSWRRRTVAEARACRPRRLSSRGTHHRPPDRRPDATGRAIPVGVPVRGQVLTNAIRPRVSDNPSVSRYIGCKRRCRSRWRRPYRCRSGGPWRGRSPPCP